MSVEQNRRKHPRLKTRVPVEFNPQGRRALASATADLSIGGCYLRIMFTFPIGTVLDVNLQIWPPGSDEGGRGYPMTLRSGMDSSLSRCRLRIRKHCEILFDSDGHAAT